MGLLVGCVEVVGVDHCSIGEAEAIALALPSAAQALKVLTQEGGHHHQIAVDEDDQLTTGLIHPKIASEGWTTVVLLQQAHMGVVSGVMP